MQQTLLIIKDKKNTLRFTTIHSNWHFLKVIKNIVDYFRTDFLGCRVGRKMITSKELEKKIFDLVHPYEIMLWKPFKGIKKKNFCLGYAGYILMTISEHNNIFMDIQTTETDLEEDDMFWNRFQYRLKKIRR